MTPFMTSDYDLTDPVDQMRHYIEQQINRKISRAHIIYLDKKTESQLKLRRNARHYLSHQRRMLRFKRKLRALVS
jgi:hypothetical protein